MTHYWTHLSAGVMLYELNYQLQAPGSKMVGRKGIQMLILMMMI